MACDASPDNATFFSVAHSGPPSASVLENPWPNTHSTEQRPDTEPPYNVQCPGLCAIDPRKNRRASAQPINFNDIGAAPDPSWCACQAIPEPDIQNVAAADCSTPKPKGGRSRPPRCHLKGRSDVHHTRVRTFGRNQLMA
jgi:hypothetical protein